MYETCRGTLAGSMGGNKLLRSPRAFIFHLYSVIQDTFALELPGTMLHYVLESTEDKERRPLTTYALDKSSYKNKGNDHNRDETSTDSNKLGMTRKFMSSPATGNGAVSPGEGNPSLFFFSFSYQSFYFYYVLTHYISHSYSTRSLFSF